MTHKQNHSTGKLNSIIEDLIEKRWSVIDNFFPSTLTTPLLDELQHIQADNRLHAAQIGKNQQKQHQAEFRGDAIHWLTGASQAQQTFLETLETLRRSLNRELFLGLNELEAHFALYPPGARYQKHLDSFKSNNLRRITIISYLNPAWSTQDGGELILYNSENTVLRSVPPLAGTLVCFASEEFPHEVAPARRPRASIAGWFRVRE